MNNEQLYYDTLRLITRYDTVERLRKRAEKDYGLSFEEALEYAYENIKGDAERAIRGKRRPRAPKTARAVAEKTSRDAKKVLDKDIVPTA
jgi:hypothetical protein